MEKRHIKRFLFYVVIAIINSVTIIASESPQQIMSMIVSFHNNAFGVDHLFDKQIANDKLLQWLEVCEIAKNYALNNSKNALGMKDSTLVNAADIIDKANKSLVNGIKITYGVRHNTKNLIKMAALFQVIENKMSAVATQLQNTRFFIEDKKNAQRILIALAMFIETTAKKANKDTRMGHRTDISIPTTPAPSIPAQQTIPLLPPADLPPIYEEEPEFAPPTRPVPPVPGA